MLPGRDLHHHPIQLLISLKAKAGDPYILETPARLESADMLPGRVAVIG
jgi:hypothetical protein